MEEQQKELQDYLVAIKKRKKGILFIGFTVFFLATIVTLLLPPVYESNSTILIEQQEIPQEMVMSTVTSYAAERIQIIQARVMSRANLMEIVEKYNLYESERRYETSEEILERITEDISLDILSAEVVDPRTGRPSSATIAFTLSFEGEYPDTVQRVANELTSLYLNENLKSRTQKAEDTSVFFKQEVDRLSGLISTLENDLAIFKQENASILPEMQALNMQTLQRKEAELTAIDARVSALQDKKFYINGQLMQIDPGNPGIESPSTRLKAAEAEYMSLQARYSPQHPDVIKLKNEIDSLKKQVSVDDVSIKASELEQLRVKLRAEEQKYTSDHPDVLATRNQVAALEKELEALRNVEDVVYASRPENPAYITLQAQLASIESEIQAVEEQKESLISIIAELEEQIQRAPQIEREYNILTRDYENALFEYKETKLKQSRADVAKQLEAENKGERFSLIDPPALPEEPIRPNRPAFIFLGFLLSVGCGLGYAFIADAISGTVRGSKDLRSLLGAAPLAVIPYQMNMADIYSKKRFQKRSLILGAVIIVSVVLLLHYFFVPLDVLWFRVMRKLNILFA